MTRPLPALLAVVAGLALAAPAQAQTRGYYSADPNVTIDLSVLGGPGNEPGDTALSAGTIRPAASADIVRTPDGLLFPPPAVPPSRLNGQFATQAPPVLRRPAAQAATDAAAAPQSRLTVAPPMSARPAPAIPAKAASVPPPQAAPPMSPKPPAAPAVTAPAVVTPPPAPVQSAARNPAPPPPSAVPPPPSLPQPAVAPTPSPPSTPAPAAAPAPATATGGGSPPPAPVATAARSGTTIPAAPASGAVPAGATSVAEVRVLFDDDSAKLPDNARDSLLGLVGKLEANENLRLQIEAYAAGTAETASQARRLSLSRALSVRSYLIEQGVRSTRMDVRALGNKASEPPAPADRVDARLVER